MGRGPRSQRARAWAWTYVAIFGPGDGREEEDDADDADDPDGPPSSGVDGGTRGGER